MKQNLTGTAIVAVVIIAAASVITFFRVKSAAEPAPVIGQSRRFNYELLTQQAASPGKVVRAVKDGKVLASYTCTSQDAAVAFLFDSQEPTSEKPEMFGLPADIGTGQAWDEQNHAYPIRCLQKGALIRLRVPRGYSKKPKTVSFRVFDGLDTSTSIPKLKSIVLDQFAEPERSIPPLTMKEIKSADDILRIDSYFYSNWVGYTNMKLAPHVQSELQKNNESWTEDLLSTAFCPEGTDEPEFDRYRSQLDVIKVRINRIRHRKRVITLTYRNAQIVTIDGERVLQFPTTQQVGMLEDAQASIDKQMLAPKITGKHEPSSGRLLIRIQRLRHPKNIETGNASFSDI